MVLIYKMVAQNMMRTCGGKEVICQSITIPASFNEIRLKLAVPEQDNVP